MGGLNDAAYEFQRINALANQDSWPNHRHPLAKLLVTILYIVLVVSFYKYDLSGILGMSVYVIILFVIGEISFKDCLKRVWVVLPLVCFLGIWNPLLDHTPLGQLGAITVTGGMISMITLVLKGIYSVLASYLLIATTSMEGICYAMQCLHVPQVLITQLLLTYRYISLFLQEAHRMSQAYALRAPGQKGIQFRMWGTFVGQLLLRSMDRSEAVYQSMLLRGYDGQQLNRRGSAWNIKDWMYLLIWTALLILLRIVPVGSLL